MFSLNIAFIRLHDDFALASFANQHANLAKLTVSSRVHAAGRLTSKSPITLNKS